MTEKDDMSGKLSFDEGMNLIALAVKNGKACIVIPWPDGTITIKNLGAVISPSGPLGTEKARRRPE